MTGPIVAPITNMYWSVNDTTPGSNVWNGSTGALVANNNATFLTWLTSQAPNPVANTPNIVSAADNGAGGTRLTLSPGENPSPFQWTTGETWNISNTGAYDGNQTITRIDATHVDIAVAFTTTVTGFAVWATIIDTLATLLGTIDQYNQTIAPTPSLAVTSGVNYQMANTPPLFFDFTASSSNLIVKLPQMNLPGSIAKLRQLIVRANSLGNSFTLEDFSGGTAQFIPSGGFMEVFNSDNSTQAGTILPVRLLQPATESVGDGSATLPWLNSLVTVVNTSANLTAPRTWTLADTSKPPAGSFMLIADGIGAISSTNTLTVSPSGTMNGSASSVVLNRPHDWVMLQSHASSDVTIVGGNGSLASTDLSDLPIPVPSGGSGRNTLTAHAVVLGEGTSQVGLATVGNAGRVFMDLGGSTDPAFEDTFLGETSIGTDFSTTNASYTLVTGFTLNFTMPVAGNVRFDLMITSSNDTAAAQLIALFLDGSNLTNALLVYPLTNIWTLAGWFITSTTAGAHTIDVRVQAQAGQTTRVRGTQGACQIAATFQP